MWEQLNNFHFLRPQLLLLFIPLALLIFIVRQRRFKSGLWGRVCDQHLLPFLLIGKSGVNSRRSLISLGVIGSATIFALAGPAWEKLPQPVFRSQAALVIVLDLSRSMDVADVKPSRLARARHKIRDILKQRKEGQTALIVYAAEAFVVTPLTEDSNTIASLTKNLNTSLMPYQGSYPEKAILKAIDLFKQASVFNGHVLLITDGIDSPELTDGISQLTKAGHRLSILGIGTEQGAPIADYRGGFVKGQDGSIVVARLDESVLRDAANNGKGIYKSLTADDTDINQLLTAMGDPRLDQEIKEQSEEFKLRSDQWREEGPWILLLLLPLVALVFRRGYLVIMVAILIPMPQSSYALDWAALWKNSDQRAKTALEAGESEKAAELFKDPEWRAAASYRAENYQATIDALESAKTPDAFYNKGNALAKIGNLQEAIQSYEQAIKLNPDHEDAKYNRDLLKEYLKKNADNKEDNQSDQNQQRQQDQNKENQQSQESQQDQSENSDSQQSKGEPDQQQNQQQDQQQSSQADDEAAKEENEKLTKQDEKTQTPEEQKSAQGDTEKNDNDSESKDRDQAHMVKDDLTAEERKQARKTEQWLRRIPDDPGGLLRRKFRYQSELDSRQAKEEPKPW